ncbi:class I adenylate-forming enzyme family protein [Chloroflexota bacterium]
MTIAEMLARNARMYGSETALIELKPSQALRREITWREFDDRANRIANALIARGVKKGDKVIHLMMNSINWLEAYFGIIRTGAWAVPLNFRFSSHDIQYCADIAEARLMILSEEFTERVTAARPRLDTIRDYLFTGEDPPPGMESLEKVMHSSTPQPAPVAINNEDECGLYFTSGTTGAPKPILLTHKNMECAAITENYHHYQKHEDNFILLSPLYHTGSKMHWFGSMIVGGRATILTEICPQNIFQAVHQESGTIVFLLVPWAQDILGAIERRELKIDDYDLSSWRLMHIGAQPVPPSLVKHWKEYFPDMQYDTTYGLSESTGPGCVHLGIENEHKVGAIGKPGFNWETRIVKDSGEDIAPGETGELVVRGNGVMKEYYKNPEKTAESIKDGWLHTGDIARTDSDGFIYLVDRKKDVIITGGENIFPVEVETVLQGHPKVYDAGVIGIPDERLGEIVAVVIDPKPGVTLTEEEVMQFCEQNLPRYKRPRRIIFDKVPRNPTGKIEKPRMRQQYTGIQESFKT